MEGKVSIGNGSADVAVCDIVVRGFKQVVKVCKVAGCENSRVGVDVRFATRLVGRRADVPPNEAVPSSLGSFKILERNSRVPSPVGWHAVDPFAAVVSHTSVRE